MNSFYSSDEEVAWGPVTLREIKSDLKRSRKPERRHTIHPSAKTASKMVPEIRIEQPTLRQEMEEKCNVSSTCDEYYSPNDSLISSSNGKGDLVQESSVYLTASEMKTTTNSRSSSRASPTPQYHHNDTHINFVKAAMNRDSYFDLQNFHQTLVEPTMLTPEKSFSHSICPNNSTESQEEVIVISSDEDECFESGNGIKSEKYSFFVNVSTDSEDFPEKNRSLREIEEGSMYKTDEASNGGTVERNFHDCTFESESSNDMNSAYTSEKNYNKLSKSSTSTSDSNSEDVLCIDEDAEASFIKENEIVAEREPSIHKADESLQEPCEDIKAANLSNGRKSRKSFVNGLDFGGSSSDDDAEAAIDLSGGNETPAVEKEKYDYEDDSLEIADEKQAVNHGTEESHNETDLLKSDHLPRPYNMSPVTIPKIDLDQFDDTYDGLSPLNNTMEMMDMLLREARETSHYDSESSKKNSDASSRNGDDDNIISASFLQKPTSSLSNAEKLVTPLKNRLDNVKITPNGRFQVATPLGSKQLGTATPGKSCKSQIPKLRKSPSGDTFKMPVTPVWQRMPSRASPKTRPNFQNIVSPVGMYIRYSPQPVFKQNVRSTKMGTTEMNPSPARQRNKENLDGGLPSVIYKPGRTQIATADRKQALPPSLEKMIKESDLTKHNRKGIVYKSATTVRQKLEEGVDLTRSTISDSLLEDPSQDVSILHKRDRPFLK